MVWMEDVTFQNFGGTALNLSGRDLYARNLTIRDGGSAAIRAENSNVLLDRPTIYDNEIGLDFSHGVRGDIIDGYVQDNHRGDIRYSDDVVVGLFDSVARYIVNDSTVGGDLGGVESSWAANRVLDTSDIQIKAENIKRAIRKSQRKTRPARIALKLARLVTGGI